LYGGLNIVPLRIAQDLNAVSEGGAGSMRPAAAAILGDVLVEIWRHEIRTCPWSRRVAVHTRNRIDQRSVHTVDVAVIKSRGHRLRVNSLPMRFGNIVSKVTLQSGVLDVL
jgi:hypothetical protein